MTRDVSLARCATLWLGVTGTAAALATAFAPDLGRLAAARTFDTVLVLLCEAAIVVCAGWLWLATSAVTLDVLRGRPHRARRGVPSGVRRLVLATCGVAVVGGALTAPSYAADHRPAPTGSVLAGLPMPDRPTALTRMGVVYSQTHRDGAPEAAAPDHLTVEPGDTLWRIAARSLPASAGDAAVAARWHRIYQLNRDVIGDDPDLIRPGQRLLLPTSSQEDLS